MVEPREYHGVAVGTKPQFRENFLISAPKYGRCNPTCTSDVLLATSVDSETVHTYTEQSHTLKSSGSIPTLSLLQHSADKTFYSSIVKNNQVVILSPQHQITVRQEGENDVMEVIESEGPEACGNYSVFCGGKVYSTGSSDLGWINADNYLQREVIYELHEPVPDYVISSRLANLKS